MLKINCLLNTPTLLQDITKQIEYYIHSNLSNDQSIAAKAIYKQLRKDKVEIDYESFGVLYDNIAIRLDPTRELMTTTYDIEVEAKKSFAATVEAVRQGETAPYEETIKKDSPERFIANAIARMLTKSNNSKSVMVQLQNAVLKSFKSVQINAQQEKVKKTAMETISDKIAEALGVKEMYDNYGELIDQKNKQKGLLGKSVTLIETVGKEIDAMVAKLRASGDHSQADELEAIGQSFQDSVNDFLLTEGETGAMVKETLKAMGFMDIKGNIDWQRIADHSTQTTVYSANDFERNLRELLSNTQQLTAKEIDFLAKSLRVKYQEIVAQTLAKESKTTASTIEKLLYYQKLIDEQPDSDILQQNYAATLAKALNIDDSKANGIAAATIELAQLFRELNNNEGVETQVFRSLVDRKIALILLRQGVTPDLIGHLIDNFMLARSIILVNPYNITQNILGGFIQVLGTGGLLNKNNFIGTLATMLDVASGGVDTVRGQNEINGQTQARDRISGAWTRGTTASKVTKTPLRVISGLQDFALAMADAANTTYSINSMINDAVEKYYRSTSADPEADIARYYKAFLDPLRVAEIQAEADKIVTALKMDNDRYRARLENEMLRGTIVTEILGKNNNDLLLTASNIYTKMMHGKADSTSILSFIPKGINQPREWFEKRAEQYKESNKTLYHNLAKIAAITAQWMGGAARWAIIAGDLSGVRLLEIGLGGKWTETSPEAIKDALNEKNKNTGARLVANMKNKDSRRNLGLIGVGIQMAMIAALFLKPDDDDDKLITNDEGFRKLLKKLVMMFPIYYMVYCMKHSKTDKPNAAMMAAMDIAGARYPTTTEIYRDVIMGRKKGEAAIATTTDIFSLNFYETFRSWHNMFVAKDKEYVTYTKPDNIRDAIFHTGVTRFMLDRTLPEGQNKYSLKPK